MPSFVLNTCGTSVLTNQTSDEQRKLMNKYTNSATWNAIPEPDRTQIKKHIEQTLATADMIEKKVAEKNEVKKAERDVLESVDNPEEREKIMQILND